jgi:diguanylate cyclase (GGDEF)-like protein/PAS domain S-box-containing protein
MSIDLKNDLEQIVSTLDLVPIGVMFVNSKTHKIVEVNRAYSDMIGMPKGKIIGMSCLSLNVCSEKKEFCTKTELKKNLKELGTFLVNSNGERIPVLRKITAYNSDGDTYYLESIVNLRTYNRETESRVKDLENKFRVIFDDAPDAYYLNDLNGTFIDGNKAAENLVGYKREELIGKNFLKQKLLSPSQISKAAKLLVLNKLGKPTEPDEFVLNTKTGKKISVEIRTYPSKVSGKDVVLGIARDITRYRELESKLRQANEKLDDKVGTRTKELAKVNKKLKDQLDSRIKVEEELQQSKIKYEKLFNEAPIGIITVNKLGIITKCNRSVCNYLSITEKDLIGKHFSKVKPIFSKDIPKYFKIFYDLLKGKKITPIEINLKGKDGKILFTECHIGTIKEEGKIIGFQMVMRDITEKKEAEDALLESEKRYRSLFENSRDGMYKTTFGGKYVDANPALVKILGYDSREELLSIDIPKQLYVSEKDRPAPNKRTKPFETYLKKKDGTIITVEINSRTIYENGKPAYYEGIVRDITERKEAEKIIKHLSFHDYLTGLYNRAFFEEEISRLDTNRQLPLTIIIGDVNGLKIINDAFGHEKGDELLCRIANVLRVIFRSEDVVARWGGDEFVVILPKTSMKEALSILERVNIALERASTKTMPLSISFGISTKKNVYKNISEVIKEAEDKMYRHKLIKKESTHSSIISSLEKALEERDYETEEHVKRMKILSEKLGRELNLSMETIDELSLLAALHDIGKISIADSIILKPQSLTRKEWEAVKKHPIIGYRIAESSGELAPIAKGILYHHEWWNGNGYPERKKGEDIPLISRIISIVDAYDAMTNDRPYRKALSKKEAIAELKKFSGSQFDPFLVKKFISIVERENNKNNKSTLIK